MFLIITLKKNNFYVHYIISVLDKKLYNIHLIIM